MRTHRRYRVLSSCADTRVLAEIASVDTVAAGRLEPVMELTAGLALLDVCFFDGKRIAVACAIALDAGMLDQRELSPFIWPIEAQGLGHDRCAKIESRLLPWIEATTINRAVFDERIRFFDDGAFEEVFRAAREDAFAGAAPYARVLQNMAPYVYALRFARGKRVAVRDECGASGAALIASHAAAISADLGAAERNERAAAWFGRDIYGPPESATADVAIGDLHAPVRIDLRASEGERIDVATPLPVDVLVEFETSQSPPVRAFSVSANVECALRAAPHIEQPSFGGSAGRIALLVRDSFKRVPDGDADEARVLAARLGLEGLQARIVPLSEFDPSSYDLVHAFVSAEHPAFASALGAARAAGKPVVVSATLPSREAAWGQTMMQLLLRNAPDEIVLEDHLLMLERRKLETSQTPLPRPETTSHLASLGAAVASATVILVPCDEDRALVAQLGLSAATIVCAPHVPPLSDAADLISRTGTNEFVLCYAPLELRANQFLLARAAADAGLPVIFAGPAADSEYSRRVRWQAAAGSVFLPEPSPAEAAALFRAARVYADVAWEGRSFARTAAAAAAGCRIVTSDAKRPAGLGSVFEADSASQSAIARALAGAWNAPAQRPVQPPAQDPLVTTAQAYAKAMSATAVRA